MAGTTAATLAVSLGILYVITLVAGQPVTVAMLGVIISMISSMALGDPDVRQRALTAALMLVPAAAAVTAGALLAPHKVAGDVVFVAIMMAATYARRFGQRATMLGMVGFMTYFFALFLGATVSMLGWLIAALAIGTLISFAMRTFVLRDRPAHQLQGALRGLGIRVGGVVDVVVDAVAADELSDHAGRRLARRVRGVGETALLVDSQLESFDLRELWPAIEPDELTLRLFDLELATEQLAGAGRRAVGDANVGDAARDRLVAALTSLRAGLRSFEQTHRLSQAGRLADEVRADPAATSAARAAALAVGDLVGAIGRARELGDRAFTGSGSGAGAGAGAGGDGSLPDDGPNEPPPSPARSTTVATVATGESAPAGETDGSWTQRLDPSLRQAIQVGVAASLAIIAGEELSPARWYWAVIATFVIFSGTVSRGQTLTKGWQRVLGTIVGVGFGVVVASLVNGNTIASITLIFLCMFIGFYLITVAYGLMVFWVSTMLALLYGLLGEFSVGLLLTRIEETAIGAAIGILVASVVLPTSTRATVDTKLRAFLSELADLVSGAGTSLAGEPASDPIHQARALDQSLTELRDSAKPLTTGVAGVRRRSSVRRAVGVMLACDHYARGLARVSGPAPAGALCDDLRRSATQVQANIDALARMPADHPGPSLQSAEPLLDAARDALDRAPPPGSEHRRLTAAIGYLRQLDLAIVGLAHDLGGPGDSAP